MDKIEKKEVPLAARRSFQERRKKKKRSWRKLYSKFVLKVEESKLQSNLCRKSREEAKRAVGPFDNPHYL